MSFPLWGEGICPSFSWVVWPFLPSWGRGWPFLFGVGVVQLCVVIIII